LSVKKQRILLELDKGVHEGCISLFGIVEVAIVGSRSPSDLPDAFDGIEFW